MPNIRFLYRFLGSRMLVTVIYNTFLVFFLWEIVERYNSVFLAGLITTISLITWIAASIPIGHLIDRVNSTKVSLLASVLTLLGAFILLAGDSLLMIYAATVFVSIGYTMKGDSFAATIKKQLSEEQFRYGNTLSQGALNVSSLIGTALGGISILYLHGYFVYLLISFAAVSALSSFPTPEKTSREEGTRGEGELRSSFRFLRGILGFIILGFMLNGLIVALDVYSSGLFHLVLNVSAVYYTLFIAFISVGGIIGASITGFLKDRLSNPLVISSLVLSFAPLFLLLAISRSAVGDIVISFVIGVLVPLINVPLQTQLMKIIPRRIFGKVQAFLRVFLSGGTPAMAAVLSIVANYFQVDKILLILGILLFPATLFAFLVVPRFMRIVSEETNHASE